MSGGRWRDPHSVSLGQGLESQRLTEQFTDTTIAAGEQFFKCHRVVLAAMSPFFQALYSSGMRESNTGDVTLAEVDGDTFATVLKYMYTGDDVVNPENADLLLKAAVMLQINGLQNLCEEFMVENVDADNCLATWKLASLHGCQILAQRSWLSVLHHFPKVCQSSDFLELDCDDVMQIINDNDLKTPNEELVCESVLKWVSSDTDSRKAFLSQLFECLRLPLVEPEYLLDNIDGNKLLEDSPECKAIIEEAKRYHLLPARRHEFLSKRLVYRNHGDYEDVLLVIGGNIDKRTTTTDVVCFLFKSCQWVRLRSLPYDIGVEFAVCSYGNAVFVSGGSGQLNTMMYFTITQNCWVQCHGMLIGRRRHAMVAVGDSLFVLGGYDDENPEEKFSTLLSVEKYGVNTGTWEDWGYLTYPVRSFSAAVLQNNIYLYGGIDTDGYNMNAVQCFDTRLKTCYHLTDLPSVSGMSCSTVFNKTVFILFPDGELLKMEEEGGLDVVATIPDFERHGYRIIHHEGKLLILGGMSSEGFLLYDMLTFNPNGETDFVFDHCLDKQRFGFGCVKSTISKRIFNS